MPASQAGRRRCRRSVSRSIVSRFTPEETFSFLDGLEARVAPEAVAPDPSELMTAKEVEELLRIDVKTVYSYVKRGLLPDVKIQSNVRFLRSAILHCTEKRQYKPPTRARRN